MQKSAWLSHWTGGEQLFLRLQFHSRPAGGGSAPLRSAPGDVGDTGFNSKQTVGITEGELGDQNLSLKVRQSVYKMFFFWIGNRTCQLVDVDCGFLGPGTRVYCAGDKGSATVSLSASSLRGGHNVKRQMFRQKATNLWQNMLNLLSSYARFACCEWLLSMCLHRPLFYHKI